LTSCLFTGVVQPHLLGCGRAAQSHGAALNCTNSHADRRTVSEVWLFAGLCSCVFTLVVQQRSCSVAAVLCSPTALPSTAPTLLPTDEPTPRLWPLTVACLRHFVLLTFWAQMFAARLRYYRKNLPRCQSRTELRGTKRTLSVSPICTMLFRAIASPACPSYPLNCSRTRVALQRGCRDRGGATSYGDPAENERVCGRLHGRVMSSNTQ
jgi:hypothetical protein